MRMIINASNMYSGGGKVMLLDFLSSAVKFTNINFILFVSPLFNSDPFKANHIEFRPTPMSQRFFVDLRIKKLSKPNDLIGYFGNIPPLIRHNNKVILLQSNRYLLENYPLSGFPVLVKIDLIGERMLFKLFNKNVDWIIVQSLVMKDLLVKMGISNDIAKIMPFKNKDAIVLENVEKIENSFLYVASGDPHKNHMNLVHAWSLLAEENIWPTLFLTLDKSMPVYNKISDFKINNKLDIIFLEKIPREDLLIYYQKVSALIYPSCFESYGLPLLEAKNY